MQGTFGQGRREFMGFVAAGVATAGATIMHVEQADAMVRKNSLHSTEGEVGEVFVVNGIELIFLN